MVERLVDRLSQDTTVTEKWLSRKKRRDDCDDCGDDDSDDDDDDDGLLVVRVSWWISV